MNIAIGATLKRAAFSFLSDRERWKEAGIFLLSLLLAILLPILAVAALLGSVEVDSAKLSQTVTANLSAETQVELLKTEFLITSLNSAMSDAGFAARQTEAQVLALLGLSSQADDPEFVAKLVGCFAEGQTDAELIGAVHAAFGTALDADEFSAIMSAIRANAIDAAGYADTSTKNNLDLVTWAIRAEQVGWGYVWGSQGELLTESRFQSLAASYPKEVGGYEEWIRTHWLGKRTADCSGLIRGYWWLDAETQEIRYGSNGIPAMGADAMYQAAAEKGPMSTMPEIPGLGVWHKGHIGIYIGNGEVVEAMSTRKGVVRTQLANGHWTAWLKIPYINYIETTEEETP